MKLLGIIAAAGLAVSAVAPIAPASAQRVVKRTTVVRNGYYHGGRRWGHRRQVCRTTWRNHRRVRTCSWRYW